MKERIEKLIINEQLSSSKFADIIGVQRSSISHILSGRNNPSLDFVQKILSKFPKINTDWLVLGKGEMYKALKQKSLFDTDNSNSKEDKIKDNEKNTKKESEKNNEKPENKAQNQNPQTNSQNVNQQQQNPQSQNTQTQGAAYPFNLFSTQENEPQIVKIVIFYNNKTFREFNSAD